MVNNHYPFPPPTRQTRGRGVSELITWNGKDIEKMSNSELVDALREAASTVEEMNKTLDLLIDEAVSTIENQQMEIGQQLAERIKLYVQLRDSCEYASS